MDIEQLNEWTETPEGLEWLKAKKPIVEKLLSEKKTVGDSLTETSQRLTVLEKQLEIEQAANRRLSVCLPLETKLKDNVFDILIPSLVEKLSSGLITENGVDGTVIKDTGGNIVVIDDIVKNFLEMPENKNNIDRSKNKTGFFSTIPPIVGGGSSVVDVGKLNGRELAKMSDIEFEKAIFQHKDKI